MAMFEAYRIGIRLSLINHVSAGLGVISGNFKQTHRDALQLQNQLKQIKMLGMTGIAVGGAGFMGLNLIGKAVKPAEEYTHQLVQMNVAGMKQLEIAKSIKAAWDATKTVPTTTASKNLEEIRDLRMVFKGVTEDAIKYMPIVQKLQGGLQIVRHGKGNSKDEAYGIAKALEMKGANIDIEKHFIPEADMMARAIVASGGKINANDFLRTFTHGRAATQNWSNEFTYELLPTLIQELKGGSAGASSNPGTALMSAYAGVVGGTITQKGLKMWNDLGLIDPKKTVWSKDGHLKGILPGGIYNSDLFQSNPFAFAQYVQQKMVEHGLTSTAKQKEAYMYLFQNRTAQFAMTQFGMQPWKFTGDQKLIQGTPSLYKSYDEMMKKDPVMKRMAATAQWENLLTKIGLEVIPAVIYVLDKSIVGFQKLTDFMGRNEKLTKTLVWGFAGLSAAMAIGGTVLTLTAGFKGLGLLLGLFTGGRGILGAVRLGVLGLSAVFNGTGSSLALALTGVNTAAVAAAGGIGYLVGTLLNYGINGAVKWLTNGKEDSLGGWIYDAVHGGNQTNSVQPGVRKQPIQVNTKVDLDGHTIANVVSRHQADDMERHVLGMGGYDTRMSPAYPNF